MRRKDEPARERPSTPWRADSEMRAAVAEFCEAHGILSPKTGGPHFQKFLDRAAHLLMDRGIRGIKALTKEEEEIARRAVLCYRADPDQTDQLVGMLEKHLNLSKKSK